MLSLWFLCGIGAAMVAKNRGASGCLWLFVGMLSGPIGLLLSSSTGVTCPKCKGRISERARVCPLCGYSPNPEFPPNTVVEVAVRAHPADMADPEPMKRCPFCAEKILEQARKCRYCGEFLDIPPEGTAAVQTRP